MTIRFTCGRIDPSAKPDLNSNIVCGLDGKVELRGDRQVTRTRGFVNLNRFKSGKAIKQLDKIAYNKKKTVKKEK